MRRWCEQPPTAARGQLDGDPGRPKLGGNIPVVSVVRYGANPPRPGAARPAEIGSGLVRSTCHARVAGRDAASAGRPRPLPRRAMALARLPSQRTLGLTPPPALYGQYHPRMRSSCSPMNRHRRGNPRHRYRALRRRRVRWFGGHSRYSQGRTTDRGAHACSRQATVSSEDGSTVDCIGVASSRSGGVGWDVRETVRKISHLQRYLEAPSCAERTAAEITCTSVGQLWRGGRGGLQSRSVEHLRHKRVVLTRALRERRDRKREGR